LIDEDVARESSEAPSEEAPRAELVADLPPHEGEQSVVAGGLVVIASPRDQTAQPE